VRIFYDTEFLEDGKTIDLISIGLVAEDGRELYLISEEIEADPLYERIGRHQWLMENVVPHLPLRERDPIKQPRAQYAGRFYLDQRDNRIVSRRYIRNAVREFIQATPDVELWAWYGAYHHVVLSQLWGPMIRHPDGVPMWTNDLRQEVQRLGDPQLPKQEGAEHDALADARWVRDAYSSLMSGS
jgi:hypothetical protein